jgi:chromosome segregation ATPase
MTTVEEKQRELDALQTAFDEYIVSSRELEEELDAELTRCQNDLTKAESCNTVLATQLSNIQPQLTSLEAKVSTISSQLANETQRRISAEMKSEEYENKLREAEGSLSTLRSSELRKLKQENEELYERLAFVEGESEDYRNELNTERERHRNDIEEMQSDMSMLRVLLKKREEEVELLEMTDIGNVIIGDEAGEKRGEDDENDIFDEETAEEADDQKATPPTATPITTTPSDTDTATKDEREEYIRTLEDELELVTEQLIEAETKLSRTQAELEDALVLVEEQQQHCSMNGVQPTTASSETAPTDYSDKIIKLESTLFRLQDEHATLQDDSKRLKEELDLALEELALSKEEIEAMEEDRKEQTLQFDVERQQLKDDVAVLQSQLKEVTSNERSREIEVKCWEEALLASKKEMQALVEEVEKLEVALQNSKADCEAVQEEMEELKTAFDETANRERVESDGQHQALEDLLAARTREVSELNEEVTNLTETNASLNKIIQQTADNLKKQETEMENRHNQYVASSLASSSTTSQELQDAQDKIHSLEGLLEAVRTELNEQRNELDTVRSSLQEKIVHVQTELTTAEEELATTKLKMAEVENERLNSQSMPVVAEDVKPTSKFSHLSWSPQPEGDNSSSPVSDFRRSHALSRPIHSHHSRGRPRSCSPTTIQRLEGDFDHRAASDSSLQVECNRLQDQNRMSVSMRSHLENEIKQLQRMLITANADQTPGSTYEEEKSSMEDLMSTYETNIDDILKSSDTELIAKEVRLMAKKMSAQKSHNAELLTRILKLQGNIQVCCRIRPMSVDESQQGLHEVAQSLSETDVACFDERTKQWKSYAFDKVWGPESTQEDVFQDVEPMVLSVIDGYNACIFAYGQSE